MKKNVSGRIISYLLKDKFEIFIILVGSLLWAGTEIVTPKVMGNITTEIVNNLKTLGHVDLHGVTRRVLILGGLYIAGTLASLVCASLLALLVQKFISRLRMEISEKIGKVSIATFDKHRKGDLLSRLTNDVDTLGKNLALILGGGFTGVIILVGVIIMMLRTSLLLTGVFAISIPLTFFTIKFITKRSQVYFKKKSKGLGDMVAFIDESFSGADVIKAFSYEESAQAEFNELNKTLYDTSYKASFMAGIIQPAMVFISNLSYVAITVVGGLQVLKGNLNVGDIQAMIQYVKKIGMPIDMLAEMANSFQSAIAAGERIFGFLDEEEEVVDKEVIESPIEKIEFKNVKFSYEEGVPVIKDLNLSVKRGETVAIVGPTGAGKTTIVNLLMRFYELNGGQILINDGDISTVNKDNLRSFYAMVLQDTWLFQGTIYDNIKYSKQDATREEVIDAAKKAYCHNFIETLPEGYDTVLKEDASNISQGQRQLLTIARAFLRDPEILILDEATSSVDTRTENLIQHAMSNLMKDRTGFIIAHRLSTIRDANTILVLDKGDIVEKGNHKELLQLGGTYAKLFEAQFLNDGEN